MLITSFNSLVAQWVQTNGPFGTNSSTNTGYARLNTFTEFDGILFAGTFEAGVFCSSDNGNNWSQLNSGLAYPWAMDIRSFITYNNILFVGTAGGIYFSTNNGFNWSKTDSGLTNADIRSFSVIGSNLFVGTFGGGVFVSSNNGLNWRDINTGLSNKQITTLIAVGTNLYAGTANGNGVYLSTNNGANWIPKITGLKNTTVWALSSVGLNLFAGTDRGVFLSIDNGDNWNPINTGFTGGTVMSFTVDKNNLFLSSWSGVFMSINNGSNWTEVNTGLSETGKYVLSVFANGANLLAGTMYDGAWKRPLSEMITDVEEEHNILPAKFSLEQNYPNPFNPSTLIKFSIPTSLVVTLKVYDLLGRDVTSLVDEEKQAGNYIIKFDGSSLSSGIYFYRLQSGNFVETKKFIIMR